MLNAINSETIKVLYRLELATEEEIQELEQRSREAQKNRELKLQQEKLEPIVGSSEKNELEKLSPVEPVKIAGPKFGRNEIVKITNGKDMKELKFKKAKPLIESGEWKII